MKYSALMLFMQFLVMRENPAARCAAMAKWCDIVVYVPLQ